MDQIRLLKTIKTFIQVPFRIKRWEHLRRRTDKTFTVLLEWYLYITNFQKSILALLMLHALHVILLYLRGNWCRERQSFLQRKCLKHNNPLLYPHFNNHSICNWRQVNLLKEMVLLYWRLELNLINQLHT